MATLAIATSWGLNLNHAWRRPRRCSQAPISAATTAELMPIDVKASTRRLACPLIRPPAPAINAGAA
jgi:hypothetical protein